MGNDTVPMLPLPEWQGDFMTESEFREESVAYARACVAHATAARDAEIEALRAECTSAEENEAIEYKLRGEAEASAERLAEAFREVGLNELLCHNQPEATCSGNRLRVRLKTEGSSWLSQRPESTELTTSGRTSREYGTAFRCSGRNDPATGTRTGCTCQGRRVRHDT